MCRDYVKEMSGYSYRTLEKKDVPAVMKLVKNAFPDCLSGDYWGWKYQSNPNFDPSLVVVAEKDGKVVGCNHWLVRDFKLSADLKVNAVLGADVVVTPEHRGQGVGKALLKFFRTSTAFKKKDVIFIYMFADPEIHRNLYRPAVGYVFAPSSTLTFTKVLNPQRIKDKFQLINQAIQSRSDLLERINGLDIQILFRLRGAPTFSVDVSSNHVEFDEGELQSADVIVEGEFPVFSAAVEGRIGLGALTKLLLFRKLRVKKGKLKIVKLFKVLRLFKLALDGNTRN
jgi:predicted N-acetyltransferase YhbS